MKMFRLRAAVPAAALMAIQLTGAALAQQQLDLPRPSPNASVSQTVGNHPALQPPGGEGAQDLG
jgi:hypothetical protein